MDVALSLLKWNPVMYGDPWGYGPFKDTVATGLIMGGTGAVSGAI